MKAVSNIKRITKTMQMIATARFQASQRRATAAKPYAMKIAELVRDLVDSADGEGMLDHPLINPTLPQSGPDAHDDSDASLAVGASVGGDGSGNGQSDQPSVQGRQLLLVLTSNRGLCGGYNANVLRTASAFLAQHKNQTTDLHVVGKKGLSYFKFTRVPVAAYHSQFTDTPEFDQVEALADQYMRAFTQGNYQSVRVVYMSFQSVGQQNPCVMKLLPLRSPSGAASDAASAPAGGAAQTGPSERDYEMSPGADVLLDELLPMTVKTQLFQCFNEAAVGEHIARMVAMKAATDAASKMGKSLTRQFNRARQSAITTELSEIIGGTAALE